MADSEILATLPARLGWRDGLARLRSHSSQTRIVGGSVIMLVGSTLVSVMNFGYNVALARMLKGPADFGNAAVGGGTLLMLASCITLSFQLVCAKFVAKNETPGAKAAVYHTLLRRSWFVGVLLSSALLLAAGSVARYLNLPTPDIVIVLALGIAFYIPLGVRRGAMQGTCQFKRLTWNFILEALTKVLGAIILMEAGFGVMGAVAAISGSVV